MKQVLSSETSVYFQQNTWRYIAEDVIIQDVCYIA
jgi:hypothetical protein